MKDTVTGFCRILRRCIICLRCVSVGSSVSHGERLRTLGGKTLYVEVSASVWRNDGWVYQKRRPRGAAFAGMMDTLYFFTRTLSGRGASRSVAVASFETESWISDVSVSPMATVATTSSSASNSTVEPATKVAVWAPSAPCTFAVTVRTPAT